MDPTMRPVDTATEVLVREIAAARQAERGPLLPILHDVQRALGCVPPEAIAVLADELNLSRADVHGVVSFYYDFRDVPGGRVVLRVCRAEACQAASAARLVDTVRERYGLAPGETDPARTLTVEQVFCLGNCALGPAAQVNGRLHGRLDEGRLCELVDEAVVEQ
jgi:formate dehydrogenase subunit gamma